MRTVSAWRKLIADTVYYWRQGFSLRQAWKLARVTL